MLAHLTLVFLKNILCVLHDNLIDELANFLFECIFDFVCASLIHNHFKSSSSYVVHVLNTHCLITFIKLKTELQNSFIFSHVSFEWNLLENGVYHFSIVIWFLGQRHVLELHNSAGGSHYIVLGIGL